LTVPVTAHSLPDRGPLRAAIASRAAAPGLRTYHICYTGSVTSADIIRALKRDGWAEVRVRGSHHHFKHPTKLGIVTVPHPKKDIPVGTLASIERQAGIKLR
jgi:predicted RNA binding protein YcfA (HicA-like mRNA interferase family)